MRAYSPLASSIQPPTGKYYDADSGRWVNKWSNRPSEKIIGLAVHHWAATSMSGFDRLIKSSDPASVNYLILNSGSLIGSVSERYRAWTSGGADRDNHRITVEIQNQTAGPNWRISDAAYDTLVRLFADVAEEHDFEPVRANIKGHQELGASTACPGPFLLPRLDDVARQAAALGGRPSKPSNPKPVRPFNPEKDKLDVDGIWGKDTTSKAQAVLGTKVDGVISNQTQAWKSTSPGLTAGWDWTGKEDDGGSTFIAKHQAVLKQRDLYDGKLDGKVGPKYFTALQKDLGTPVDGKVSKPSRMVAAFQKRLNAGRI
jgi:hypothetical protein